MPAIMDNPPETYTNAINRPRAFQLRGDIALSLAFHKGDWESAKLLLDLITRLEPMGHVDVILSISGGPETLPDEEWRLFHKKCTGYFRKVDINKTPFVVAQKVFVPGTDQATRDWRPNNTTFRGVIDYFAYFRKDVGAFYYMEPDCVPLKHDWFSQLCAEYKTARKPFMGVIRKATNSVTGTQLPNHMNGSGFYPNPVSEYSHMLYVASLNTDPLAAPFDVAGGGEVTPKCHPTKLMYVDFSATPNINPEAVIWHGDKQDNLKYTELEKLGAHGIVRVDHVTATKPIDPSIGITVAHIPQNIIKTPCEEGHGHGLVISPGTSYENGIKAFETWKKNVRPVLYDDENKEEPKNAYEAYLSALNHHGHCKASWMRAVKKHKSLSKS